MTVQNLKGVVLAILHIYYRSPLNVKCLGSGLCIVVTSSDFSNDSGARAKTTEFPVYSLLKCTKTPVMCNLCVLGRSSSKQTFSCCYCSVSKNEELSELWLLDGHQYSSHNCWPVEAAESHTDKSAMLPLSSCLENTLYVGLCALCRLNWCCVYVKTSCACSCGRRGYV